MAAREAKRRTSSTSSGRNEGFLVLAPHIQGPDDLVTDDQRGKQDGLGVAGGRARHDVPPASAMPCGPVTTIGLLHRRLERRCPDPDDSPVFRCSGGEGRGEFSQVWASAVVSGPQRGNHTFMEVGNVLESMLADTDEPTGSDVSLSMLELSERQDADGAVRLTLIGELDLSVTDRLRGRLDQLGRSQRRVRLDLSQLEFIDCSGLRAILNALAEARGKQRALEVDRQVSPNVSRVISLVHIASDLWPADALGDGAAGVPA
jgi:anti-anti-sigma factor